MTAGWSARGVRSGSPSCVRSDARTRARPTHTRTTQVHVRIRFVFELVKREALTIGKTADSSPFVSTINGRAQASLNPRASPTRCARWCAGAGGSEASAAAAAACVGCHEPSTSDGRCACCHGDGSDALLAPMRMGRPPWSSIDTGTRCCDCAAMSGCCSWSAACDCVTEMGRLSTRT